MKFTCPCCGYKTMKGKPPGTYEICEICFWEDDGFNFMIMTLEVELIRYP